MRVASLASLLLVVAATFAARPAHACSIPQSGLSVGDVPANGVVLLHSRCYNATPCFEGELADAADAVEVFEYAAGAPVPGAVVRVGGSLGDEAAIAWKPDAPLTEGTTYEVRLGPAFPVDHLGGYTFMALPAAPLSAADLEVREALDRVSGLDAEHLECDAVWVDSCGGSTAWVPLTTRTAMNLNLALGDGLDASSPLQFVVRSAFWAEGEPEPEPAPARWPRHYMDTFHEFRTRADSYCYRLEVESLVDGSVATHRGCLPHGDHDDVGVEAVDPDQLAGMLASCEQPPTGYESDWCVGNARACAEAQSQGQPGAGCDELAARCRELGVELAEPVPLRDGDVPGPGDRVEPPAPGSDDDAPASRHVEACAVTAPGAHGGSGTGWLLSALALLWGARPRRGLR